MHIRSRSNLWSAARKRCVRALTTKSTVDPRELEQFGRLAHEWWRPHSSTFAALHSFNDVRVPFVERVAVHAGLENGLENAKTLDVGCGGGILSEAFCRRRAHVTGIDAEPRNIVAARQHATKMRLHDKITYEAISAEELCQNNTEEFDVVVCSEVIEHVSDMNELTKSLVKLTRPGGVIIMTTINRTLTSLLGAVFAAEYILNIVPAGTHQWHKFVPPEELSYLLRRHGASVKLATGFEFSPFSFQWRNTKCMTMNYGIGAIKGHTDHNKNTDDSQKR